MTSDRRIINVLNGSIAICTRGEHGEHTYLPEMYELLQQLGCSVHRIAPPDSDCFRLTPMRHPEYTVNYVIQHCTRSWYENEGYGVIDFEELKELVSLVLPSLKVECADNAELLSVLLV